MAPLIFSEPDIQNINMYQAQFTGEAVDSQQLKDGYPYYLKILKFHFPALHKSVIFLNRYLVSTIDDDAKLLILSTNLTTYLAGRGDTQEKSQAWNDSHNVIQGLLDDPTLFNTEIVRESTIVNSLYTENLNMDEGKFSVIGNSAELDDGTKSLFIDVPAAA